MNVIVDQEKRGRGQKEEGVFAGYLVHAVFWHLNRKKDIERLGQGRLCLCCFRFLVAQSVEADSTAHNCVHDNWREYEVALLSPAAYGFVGSP